MKKLLFLISIVAVVAVLGLTTKPAMAAKSTCTTIQSGQLKNSVGGTITTGYDEWGYNYQANMFNGRYCGAYRDAAWCTALPYKDVNLMMKWNNAWLSNESCDADNLLDRHFGYPSYIGSGAWLTNHATGTYTSAIKHNWNITGVYDVVFTLGGNFPHSATITQTGTNLSGVLAYPGYSKTIITGTVIGNDVNMTAIYSEGGEGTVQLTGTIASDGSMSGSWSDTWPVADGPVLRNGTWSTVPGVAHEVYDITCTVSDFVKIVAAPADAYLDKTVTDYYNEGMWYTDDTKTTEIGPALWGEFAVIQEIASDPCGEYGVIDYMSPLRKGLGNWVSEL